MARKERRAADEIERVFAAETGPARRPGPGLARGFFAGGLHLILGGAVLLVLLPRLIPTAAAHAALPGIGAVIWGVILALRRLREPYGRRPEELAVLEEMLRMRRECRGDSPGVHALIADRLNAAGRRNRFGRIWTARSVARVLERYGG